MKKVFLFIFCTAFSFFCVTSTTLAQDTLPGFTVRSLSKGKVQISWINPYQTCIQLAIQRSYDSIRSFQTIFSAQSPRLPQNGFIDNNSLPGVKFFYRIFYVIEGGNYFFTKSKSPGGEGAVISGEENSGIAVRKRIDIEKVTPAPYFPAEKKFIKIYNRDKDSLLFVLEYSDYKNFKDSISIKTKDSLLAINNSEVILKPYIPKYTWKPSVYVFTNNNGYVMVSLPLVKQHIYRIVFYDESGSELFQIKHIKEDRLVLDKTNFLHAGWFSFALYEDDKLKEKSRFYLESDF